jgi:ribosomal protein L24E
MPEQRCQFCGGRVEPGSGQPGIAGRVLTFPAECVECGERPKIEAP